MEKSNSKSSDELSLIAKFIDIPTKGNNFGLSKNEFDNLVDALKRGKEELFETIFISHFQNCKIYIMKKHGISKETAYDITMDTLIDFRKLIIQDKVKYGNLRFLFTKIASQNYIRSNKKKDRIDLKQFYNIEEYEDKEHLYNALTLAWENLDEETKKIMEGHFYNKTPLVKLAEMMGKSDSFIRKKKQRGLEKIRSILFGELGIKKQ